MQWPPRALASGYSMQPGKAALRTEMDSGHARQRRTSASVPERIKAQWRLTGLQVKVWRSWWKHELLDGTVWFPCELSDGQGVATASCRFVGEPTITLESGNIFTVSGEVEVEDLPLMSPEDLEAYLAS
jgi:hypothetical protein